MITKIPPPNPTAYSRFQPLHLIQLKLVRFVLNAVEEHKHSLMSSFGSLSSLFGAHHAFELEQFIVEMRNTVVGIPLV